MRKMLLCALAVFGFMNLSLGQGDVSSERVFVRTYDENGIVAKYKLTGSEALAFDVPAFIKENDHLERVIINSDIVTPLLTTRIKFDSRLAENTEGEYLCKDEKTKLTPFLGVRGTSRISEFAGVDIISIIPKTSAEVGKIIESEDIIGFDGLVINNFQELKKAVLAKQIGDKVELLFEKDSDQYSKYVILGSRGTKTISYKYCDVEPIEMIENRNLNVIVEDVSLSTFPNPTRAFSHVDFSSESVEDVTFRIVDIKGGLIHTELFSNFKGNLSFDYDLSSEVAGTYIFTVQQGKEVYNQKVQLMK